MPPVYGLYTACFPLIIYALLGTSGQLSVGPVAVVSLLVGEGAAGIVEPHLENGEPNPEFIGIVVAVCLLVSMRYLESPVCGSSAEICRMLYIYNKRMHICVSEHFLSILIHADAHAHTHARSVQTCTIPQKEPTQKNKQANTHTLTPTLPTPTH
jgi:hypothetical protein